MKSVPVGVKSPGRRRTGFRCCWVAVGRALEFGSVRLRAERSSDPARDGGHRDRGRRGHGQAPGSAAARAHSACRGAGRLHRGGDPENAGGQSVRPAVGARPAGVRAAGSGTRRAGGAARGEGAIRRPVGSGSPLPPAPAWRSAKRWRSGCRRRRRKGQMKGIGAAVRGGRQAASVTLVPIPPGAPPHPLGTLRASDAHPASPRDNASLCPCALRAPPAARSSGRQYG